MNDEVLSPTQENKSEAAPQNQTKDGSEVHLIPTQLQKENFGFVKLLPRSKKPFEGGWQNRPYSFAEIQPWFELGNNYGVLCGCSGLIVIDADRPEIDEIIRSKLPETFTVKTPGGGHHYYYICKEETNGNNCIE